MENNKKKVSLPDLEVLFEQNPDQEGKQDNILRDCQP